MRCCCVLSVGISCAVGAARAQIQSVDHLNLQQLQTSIQNKITCLRWCKMFGRVDFARCLFRTVPDDIVSYETCGMISVLES